MLAAVDIGEQLGSIISAKLDTFRLDKIIFLFYKTKQLFVSRLLEKIW